MMKAVDYFALALRIVGVLMLAYGIRDVVDSLLFKLGYFNYLDSTPSYYVITGLASTIAGLYLLRGAPGLVRFAYPANDEDEDEETLIAANRGDRHDDV